MGGKARIGSWIAEHVKALGCGSVWEPFCGGLNATRHLRSAGLEVETSDVFEPLIRLFQAVADGWDPPAVMSEAEYKAWCAEGGMLGSFASACSFGGVWGGGYAGKSERCDPVKETRLSLLRDCPGQRFHVIDFLAVEPRPASFSIYADPPYAGTTSYKGRPPFDHVRFWDRVRGWEACGVPVLVSEYTAPEDFECVASREVRSTASRDKTLKIRIERLWRLGAKIPR